MTPPRIIQRIGLVGMVGALLLGVAAWGQFHWLPMQRAMLDQQASQARRMRHELMDQTNAQARSAQDATLLAASPDRAWQWLWQSLPWADQRVALQTEVLTQARQHGLVINTVQYQGQKQDWATQTGATLWRQRMVMPTEGPYQAVRAWVLGLLKQPALSIDSVDLQRPDIMGDQVKARVTVSLWWRQRSDATASPSKGATPLQATRRAEEARP